ncbi:beta-lactamase [Anaerovibrio lipolyticus]|uniref:Beta-lactamase n=1 Tax=Anaerovibrio lipolyticus TaxID=82374 RepID=A0A0B2K331_9FIRM|nr:MBL fold metallo-hydrolase [Anaerovibrio lipolyticus]KHM53166.1 beta-lactamase [Anaerovibrio lipolyticus]
MDFSVKSFEVGPVAANCYILKDNDSNEGMVIDPGGNPDKILSAIKEMGVEVKLIALTHGHFDHIGGLGKVKNALNVPVAIHEADGEMLTDAKKNLSAFVGAPGEMEAADVLLKDGDNISFGGCSLKVIHTPGHTQGGVCFYGGGALFSGDTLFAGSVGRTDFPGSSTEDILDSIRNRLAKVSDSTKVFPGHGPASTMGIERETNPFF